VENGAAGSPLAPSRYPSGGVSLAAEDGHFHYALLRFVPLASTEKLKLKIPTMAPP